MCAILLNCLTRYDVLTTGATASACARVLLGAGAGAVDVLTLTRVVRAAF
jgi:predicted amidophosphoribosyltransferase